MLPLSPRALRLIRAGEARWGVGRWHAAMARASGVSQTYITLMAAGTKPVTDRVEKRLLHTLQQERKNLKTISAELAKVIAEIKKDMDHE
jgi:predicted transcriptional regulator